MSFYQPAKLPRLMAGNKPRTLALLTSSKGAAAVPEPVPASVVAPPHAVKAIKMPSASRNLLAGNLLAGCADFLILRSLNIFARFWWVKK